jgi:hypothetical protein
MGNRLNMRLEICHPTPRSFTSFILSEAEELGMTID